MGRSVGSSSTYLTDSKLGWTDTVENLERNLFVLPRERRMEEDEYTGEMYETDVVPTLADIYSDFDKLRQKARIGKFKAKFVKRKYAFGEKDVPREERDWLKVVYPFTGMCSRDTGEPGFSLIAVQSPSFPTTRRVRTSRGYLERIRARSSCLS